MVPTLDVPLLGDINGDGEISTADILDLIDDYGCNEDCGNADIDGDGVVGASDILGWLGAFGGG